MTKRLASREIYEICDGSYEKTTIDFSAIDNDKYHVFFDSIPTFLHKKVKKLEINTNTKTLETDHDLYIQSIAQHQPHFMQYLIQIFIQSLPIAQTLEELTFRHVHLNKALVPQLFASILKCVPLRSIIVIECKLRDDSFIEFLSNTSPYAFDTLIFNNCMLTSESFPAIVKFLSCSKPGKEWRLTTFDLTDNQFTPSEFDTIDKLMRGETVQISQEEEEATAESHDELHKEIQTTPEEPTPEPHEESLPEAQEQHEESPHESQGHEESIPEIVERNVVLDLDDGANLSAEECDESIDSIHDEEESTVEPEAAKLQNIEYTEPAQVGTDGTSPEDELGDRICSLEEEDMPEEEDFREEESDQFNFVEEEDANDAQIHRIMALRQDNIRLRNEIQDLVQELKPILNNELASPSNQ